MITRYFKQDEGGSLAVIGDDGFHLIKKFTERSLLVYVGFDKNKQRQIKAHYIEIEAREFVSLNTFWMNKTEKIGMKISQLEKLIFNQGLMNPQQSK